MPLLDQYWNLLFFDPMLNGLILLSTVLFGNFGLTIVAFTAVVRLLILPLTLKQLQASKSMSTLQPKIKELQNRYGKDRERLSQETMALYKEHGVNPLGCAVPTLIQFPIWIGLYQAIIFALGDKPDNFKQLAAHLYPNLEAVRRALPIENGFLWLNLAHPDPTYALPILVGATMWIQQKMMTVPSADPQQQQMNQIMQITMPLMFGFFTIQFPSGLAIYWVASNFFSIVLQYFVTGWGSLLPEREPVPVGRPPAKPAPRPRAGKRKK